MKYNFDEIINRKHTNCIKYDCCEPIFGTNDVFPMWVADMDFRVADFIMDALKNRLNHPIFGYLDHSEGFYNSIIEWMEKRHNWNIKKEWLCFSPGICTAISVIIHALTNPN
ncbi:MAG: cystathionine beta-lyase, partial [Bacteroidetes bacterium]|nr:cystathionine beta-lyase [Bacteroidota bacterium]